MKHTAQDPLDVAACRPAACGARDLRSGRFGMELSAQAQFASAADEDVTFYADVAAGHPAELPGLSPGRRHRPDAAADLPGRSALVAAHPGHGRAARDAPVPVRRGLRRAGAQVRSAHDRGGHRRRSSRGSSRAWSRVTRTTCATAPMEWPDPGEFRLAEQFGPPDVIVRSTPYTFRPRVRTVGGSPSSRRASPRIAASARSRRSRPSRAGPSPTTPTRASGWRAARVAASPSTPSGSSVRSSRTVRAAGRPPNSQVAWDIHYWPNGVEVTRRSGRDRHLAAPRGLRGRVPADADALLPRRWCGRSRLRHRAAQHAHDARHPPVGHACSLDSWQPHGHTRLVAMRVEVLRADGRSSR